MAKSKNSEIYYGVDEDQAPNYMVLSGETAFRVETDHKLSSAVVSFGDSMAGYFSNIFEDFINSGVLERFQGAK